MVDFFRHTGFTTIVGIVAGVLTAISMLPQLIKTFKKKESADISLIMLIILDAGISAWIYYGVLRNDYPILFTNAFSLLINLTLLVLHFKYKK